MLSGKTIVVDAILRPVVDKVSYVPTENQKHLESESRSVASGRHT